MNFLNISIKLLVIFEDESSESFAIASGVIVLIALAGLIAGIFYILTLEKTLKAISEPNRTMRPGQVWLLLIPFFSLLWSFFVVNAISESIEKEYRSRNIPVESKPAYKIGLAMSIINCCWLLMQKAF